MNYLSVCSGIEAATVAWHPLGWKAFAYSEIEKFPCKLLKHHYPDTPNFGDMTKFKEWPDAAIHVLVGGTPCQSFSIAGLRKGLDDARGNLMLTFGAIAAKYRPDWMVWENVYGVLSSNGGKDFASFLGLITGQKITVPGGGWRNSGIIPGYKNAYGVAYRVLDSEYVRTDGHPHAVPQRRRRIILVGYIGDWRRAAAVLFDTESMSGNPPPRREKGQAVAGTISKSSFAGGGMGGRVDGAAQEHFQVCGTLGARIGLSIGAQDAACGHLLPVAPTLDASYGEKMDLDNQHINSGGGCSSVAKTLVTKTRLDSETETLITTHGGHFDNAIALAGNTIGRKPENGGNGNGFDESGVSYTLTTTDQHAVAFNVKDWGADSTIDASPTMTTAHTGLGVAHAFKVRGGKDGGGKGYLGQDESATGQDQHLYHRMQVRRLTPLECERLQAFPDYYTDIPGASDSTRYKALGNSMSTNVMRLIGERIQMIDTLIKDDMRLVA